MIPIPTYLQNPVRPLSAKEKKRLALAGVGIVGLGLLAWWVAGRSGGPLGPSEKKDYGILVDDLCVNATITDHEKLRRAIEDTYDTQVDAGVSDPFTMATAFFARIAPQCHVSPRDARSPKEAEFYLTAFVAFLEQLEIDGLITDDEARAKMFEAMAWASRGGWKPDKQLASILPDEQGGG